MQAIVGVYLSGMNKLARSYTKGLESSPQALHRLLSWRYVIIVRADKNRDTAGRKDIEFYLFYEYIVFMHCTYCTLRPTFQNSGNGNQESFRLRARDASVGENEVLNSTDQTFFCSRWILYLTLLLENLCTMMLADAMKTLVRSHQPQLHLLQ